MFLTIKVFCSAASLVIVFVSAPYISPRMTQHQAFESYYEPEGFAVYGYATRYGSDLVAFNELMWEAREYVAQDRHGFALIGGGYGYHTIEGREWLADNRSSYAYSWLIRQPKQKPNSNQRRLGYLASMTTQQARAYVDDRYLGIISTRSPNDLGREFCLLRAPSMERLGLVIVGGVAARHDWTPWGPSKNDDFGHARLGQRTLMVDGQPWRWVADLADAAYYAGGQENKLVALGPAWVCDASWQITTD